LQVRQSIIRQIEGFKVLDRLAPCGCLDRRAQILAADARLEKIEARLK
jgi:hypothetical protein